MVFAGSGGGADDFVYEIHFALYFSEQVDIQAKGTSEKTRLKGHLSHTVFLVCGAILKEVVKYLILGDGIASEETKPNND